MAAAGAQRGVARCLARNHRAAVESRQRTGNFDRLRRELAIQAQRAAGCRCQLHIAVGRAAAQVDADAPAVLLVDTRQDRIGQGFVVGPAQLRGAWPPGGVKVHLAVVHHRDAAPRDPGDVAKNKALKRDGIHRKAARQGAGRAVARRTFAGGVLAQRAQRQLRHHRAIKLGQIKRQTPLPKRSEFGVQGEFLNRDGRRLRSCQTVDSDSG